MSISLKFNVGSDYPENFPKSISMATTESLSQSSFEESFQAAQKACLPYYSVTVVESGNSGERFYQVYDTAYFARTDQTRDAITRRPIRKIHYFATQCFQFDASHHYQSITPTGEVNFTPFSNYPDSEINKALLDSTNANIFHTGKPEAQVRARRAQYLIAELIKQKQIFPALEIKERNKEILRWLWCSAQGSYHGLLNLIQEGKRQKIHSDEWKQQLANLLFNRLLLSPYLQTSLTPTEKNALEQVFRLLYPASHEKEEKATEEEAKLLPNNVERKT